MKKQEKKTNLNDYKTYLFTSQDNGFDMLTKNISRNTFLSDFAIRLFTYINSHNRENFYLSLETIANYLKISKSKVARGISELKKHGFLKLERKENENIYYYNLINTPKINDLPNYETETIFYALIRKEISFNDFEMMKKKKLISNEQYKQINNEIIKIAKVKWIKKDE